MVTALTSLQRARLAQDARRRFVAEMGRVLPELGGSVQSRINDLMSEAAPSREVQNRRDAWAFYQSKRTGWLDEAAKGWESALIPPVKSAAPLMDSGMALVDTSEVENKIIASRLVLGVMEAVTSELNDLRLRIKHLDDADDLDVGDILRPEVLILVLVEKWMQVGMPRHSWSLVNDTVLKLLTLHLKAAYVSCNKFLISQGVLPTIELKDRVKRSTSVISRPIGVGVNSRPTPIQDSKFGIDSGQSGYFGTASTSPAGHSQGGVSRGQLGWSGDHAGGGGVSSSARHSGQSFGSVQSYGERQSSGYGGGSIDETRMLTSATPIARARSRAQGVLGQLKRLLIGSGVDDSYSASAHRVPSPALAAAIATSAREVGGFAAGGTVIQDYSPAGVVRVANELRQRTAELKSKAETKSEKATIEIVALMFQAILQEDRIPPTIRVWFARLQMPVLRVALAEPDFFGTLNHPARQLIDRMGSCVMGFDASGIHGNELETEIKRVVQVIEQYPETGKRVYELVYDEFKKFLERYLTGRASTQKVVSVAQQVEQKETLTIQYTIEMRNVLKDVPVRDEIREFLFKVWAEVLAVVAVRKGPQHVETLELKKTATDLVWAASAKPNRADRAKVIRDLPQLLQRLRAGMSLLGIESLDQDAYIKSVSDTLADAFLSKTQAIPPEQIEAMAQRLAHLEDFVSDDAAEDLPLDAQGIEMMLGIDASTLDVVASGGSQPTPAMVAWAHELQSGAWFTLDHNGRLAQVQYAWRSDRKHLHLFAAPGGHSYLFQITRLAAYLQAGLLLPQEEEALTVRATRNAVNRLNANPERLLG